MKKVLLRGPVLTQSGYAVHTRQIAKWLLSRDDIDVYFQALPWGNTPWLIDRNREDGLVGRVMDKTWGPPQDGNFMPFDVTFQVQLPNEWDEKLGRFNVGITAAVETDKCNPEWGYHCAKMSKVIVPSIHAKSNLQQAFNSNVKLGSTKDIQVIPEAYAPACAKPSNELPIKNLPDFSTNFNFLIFGQLTGNNPDNDRKNIFYTLKWLFEEFKDQKDVGIVLKTNSGRNTLIDNNNVVGMMNNLINEIRKSPFPRLHIIHGDMFEEEVAALYKHPKVKALVAATRGEGYGLPILEAAASGLPIVATGWSGHMDFLKKGKFVSLYYTLKEVHKTRIDNKIFLPGMRWAEPSESDFKQRVRKLYKSYQTPKEWAIDLETKIIDEYSFETISKEYDKILNEL